jgi:hypothetical protein
VFAEPLPRNGSIRSNIILHLRQGFPSDLFPSG